MNNENLTIAEQLTAVNDIKHEIKDALVDKGVNMTNVPFTEYPLKVKEIQGDGVEQNFLDFANGNSHVTLPKGLTRVRPFMFHPQCIDIWRVTIPEGVTSIEWGSFTNTQIGKVDFPNSLVTIGGWAFENSSLFGDIVLGENIQSIGTDAFIGTWVQSITINRPPGSISGAPWGATNATVMWTG